MDDKPGIPKVLDADQVQDWYHRYPPPTTTRVGIEKPEGGVSSGMENKRYY